MPDREASTDEFVPMLREVLAREQTPDGALVALRAAGASQLLSVAAVAIVQRCPLVDVKRAAQASPAWSEIRRRQETIADELSSAPKQEA